MGIIKTRGSATMQTSIPVYVTRKTANGETGSFSLSLWMSLLALMLVWANIVLWSLFGIFAFFWLAISAIF